MVTNIDNCITFKTTLEVVVVQLVERSLQTPIRNSNRVISKFYLLSSVIKLHLSIGPNKEGPILKTL